MVERIQNLTLSYEHQPQPRPPGNVIRDEAGKDFMRTIKKVAEAWPTLKFANIRQTFFNFSYGVCKTVPTHTWYAYVLLVVYRLLSIFLPPSLSPSRPVCAAYGYSHTHTNIEFYPACKQQLASQPHNETHGDGPPIITADQRIQAAVYAC